MPKEVVDYVSSRGIPQQEVPTLEEAIRDTDVLYMTRWEVLWQAWPSYASISPDPDPYGWFQILGWILGVFN